MRCRRFNLGEKPMNKRTIISIFFLMAFGLSIFAQDYRQEIWKEFGKQNWQNFDFAKKKLTKVQLDRLKTDQEISELELLRGVVFGKRGRIFKEKSIQEYLEKQSWYKPNPNFTNALLTKTERDNLDLIRLKEAETHTMIQPGDMRIWQAKLISEDNLGSYTAAEWRVLIAEIEAIHGKTFEDEQWLQKYFDERYWYKPNPNYSPAVLNETERKNLEFFLSEKSKGRNTAISIGDMENFQSVALTEDLLKGLSLMELRMIRNEIWARRGRKFETPGIRQYFEWRDWYKPLKDQRKVKLSETEQQNVNLILAQEAKIREKLSTEELPEETLSDLFTEDLRVLRNEIYARRGRIFKDGELQKYFAAQPWYQPNPDFKDEQLSEIEFKNLASIKKAEEAAISKFSEFEG